MNSWPASPIAPIEIDLLLPRPQGFSGNNPPTKAHADFQELIAVGKPEDQRAGPMVNGDPRPVRVFRVVDNFDGAGRRYVRHGAAKYSHWPPVAGP